MSKYMKLNYSNGSLMYAVKQTKEGVLTVSSDSISLDTILALDDHYNSENGYKPTTKKVFDKMYNETINRLNKLA